MVENPLLSTLMERGFVKQTTPLDALNTHLCADKKPTLYLGFDATAPSLHVGNLMGLMAMRWAKDCGYSIIILLGGGTTRIGDPSGKNKTRQILDDETIRQNIAGIRRCVEKLIDSKDSTVHFVNNADWLDTLKYTEFLRDIGVHFSVNRMIKFDSVQSRLDRDSALTFTEFNYILLQSYDFLELYNRYGCTIQMGGSDQWGNIVSGVDLVRRMAGVQTHGITWPLLQTASGDKMGKSVHGAVWMDESLLSPYNYWQFWRNVDDWDVVRFLKIFTLLPMKDIQAFEDVSGVDLVHAKKLLADNATALIHGSDVLTSIHRSAEKAFSADLSGLSEAECQHWPSYCMDASELEKGLFLIDVLVALGFASSRSMARKKIREGAVKIAEQTIHDELYQITQDIFGDQYFVALSLGRKKKALLKMVNLSHGGGDVQ